MRFNKLNKKGISEIVSYVLLVVLALGLATGTYAFLSSYTNPFEEGECSEGLSITVTNFSCGDGFINLTLKNNGRFDLAGVIINGVNITGSQEREIQLYDHSTKINVSNETILPTLSYSQTLQTLSYVKLYPYIVDKEGYNRLCDEAIVKIKVNSLNEEFCTNLTWRTNKLFKSWRVNKNMNKKRQICTSVPSEKRRKVPENGIIEEKIEENQKFG